MTPLEIPARTRVLFKAGAKLRDGAESSIDSEVFFGLGGGVDVLTEDAPDLLLQDIGGPDVRVDSEDQDVVDFFEGVQDSTKKSTGKSRPRLARDRKKDESASSETALVEPTVADEEQETGRRVVEPAWFAKALAQRRQDWETPDEGGPTDGSQAKEQGGKGSADDGKTERARPKRRTPPSSS